MVPLVRVGNGFHARVLVARLGSEGIVTQLRGGIDAPYPAGAVEVLVGEADLDDARAILLADEVEAAFDVDDAEDGVVGHDGPGRGDPGRRRRGAALVGGALAAAVVVADVVAAIRRR